MSTNQGFKSMVPNRELLEPSYLYHWLRSKRSYLEGLGNGATFKEVSKAVVARVKIPVPPLSEQRRIAAILDQADALRVKRQAALARLDEMGRAIFVGMFGNPGAKHERWPMGLIGDLLSSASYGSSEKAGLNGRLPMLRMNNIRADGSLDLRDLKYIDLQKSDASRYMVERGDILFNRTNSAELVGKTAVFNISEPYAFAGYLVRLRVNARAAPEYIAGFLNSAHGKAVLRGMCKSIIGMANINAKEVQSIRIPVPPRDLQSEYANKLERIASARVVRERSLSQIACLASSLQHRAFRGGL